jgi:hypothetical protein
LVASGGLVGSGALVGATVGLGGSVGLGVGGTDVAVGAGAHAITIVANTTSAVRIANFFISSPPFGIGNCGFQIAD